MLKVTIFYFTLFLGIVISAQNVSSFINQMKTDVMRAQDNFVNEDNHLNSFDDEMRQKIIDFSTYRYYEEMYMHSLSALDRLYEEKVGVESFNSLEAADVRDMRIKEVDERILYAKSKLEESRSRFKTYLEYLTDKYANEYRVKVVSGPSR